MKGKGKGKQQKHLNMEESEIFYQRFLNLIWKVSGNRKTATFLEYAIMESVQGNWLFFPFKYTFRVQGILPFLMFLNTFRIFAVFRHFWTGSGPLRAECRRREARREKFTG